MPGILRAALVLTAAAAAASMFYVGATLPAPPLRLDGPVPDTHVSGAYHVHSARSGGTGTVDEIAAAAARANLRFVIITDHGDGTRTPDPPAYRHGVLCLDAVEVSTDSGHLVALGLSGPAPYPLAGRARDVVEDVHRLGGFAVLAHPDSPRGDLRWRQQGIPFDGIEWLNADSEWRDDSPGRLAGAALRALIRPPGAIASLFGRPARTLQRWDAASMDRPVVGLAALDVHARIGWGDEERAEGARTILEQPSYVSMFRTVAQTVVLDAPLGGDAAGDASRLLAALSSGRTYSVVRALAEPAALEFQAFRQSRVAAVAGDRIPATGEATRLRARVPGAPGIRLVLLHNGRQAAAGHGTLEYEAAIPGVYRIEGMFPNADVPWLASNPIVIGADVPRGAPMPPASTDDGLTWIPVPTDGEGWKIERAPSSAGEFTAGADDVRFEFRLADDIPHGQYSALVNDVLRDASVTRLQFTARASAPMRVSVQVRLPGGRDSQRWRRSVYVDPSPRAIDLRLEDFEPADAPTSRRPIGVPVHALLFVVDTVNTAPGAAGTLWISDVRFGAAAAESR